MLGEFLVCCVHYGLIACIPGVLIVLCASNCGWCFFIHAHIACLWRVCVSIASTTRCGQICASVSCPIYTQFVHNQIRCAATDSPGRTQLVHNNFVCLWLVMCAQNLLWMDHLHWRTLLDGCLSMAVALGNRTVNCMLWPEFKKEPMVIILSYGLIVQDKCFCACNSLLR